jgi:tetratricopeptide (TPR) repeat protein
MLYKYMPAYQNLITYWEANVDNFPNVAMGYNQYGLALVQAGFTGSGIDTWLRGIKIRPNDFRLNYNLANILMATGQTQIAVDYLKKAELYLDQKQSRDFWMENINKLKAEATTRGVQL